MKRVVDLTTNPSVYKKAYKGHVCKKTGQCSRCTWHRGENLSNTRKVRRNWKRRTKSPNQYRKVKKI